jgi:hypothetical protein
VDTYICTQRYNIGQKTHCFICLTEKIGHLYVFDKCSAKGKSHLFTHAAAACVVVVSRCTLDGLIVDLDNNRLLAAAAAAAAAACMDNDPLELHGIVWDNLELGPGFRGHYSRSFV